MSLTTYLKHVLAVGGCLLAINLEIYHETSSLQCVFKQHPQITWDS